MHFYLVVSVLCFIFYSSHCSCQTRLIFTDDTLLQEKFMGEFENSQNQPYHVVNLFDFKEKLPDGLYKYIDADRKDSSRIDIEEHVLIKGEYLDSLRTGRFEYFSNCRRMNKKEDERTLVTVYYYNKGLLDGYYMANRCGQKLQEGYYKDGKRHGFFYYYSYANGELEKTELFKEGSLLYQSKKGNTTIVFPVSDTTKVQHWKLE